MEEYIIVNHFLGKTVCKNRLFYMSGLGGKMEFFKTSSYKLTVWGSDTCKIKSVKEG